MLEGWLFIQSVLISAVKAAWQMRELQPGTLTVAGKTVAGAGRLAGEAAPATAT